MLIKIMTNQNTVKIISNIDDVEIHHAHWHFDNRTQLNDSLVYGPGAFIDGTHPLEVECYDKSCFNTPHGSHGSTSDIISSSEIKLVDYKKGGQWNRVAIVQYAYVCNDDGKTIAKVA